MDSILQIIDAIKQGEIKASNLTKESLNLNKKFKIPSEAYDKISNKLFYMDNLHVIRSLLSSGYSKTFDLIYLDPPFFTNSIFNKNIIIETNEETLKLKVPVYNDNTSNRLDEYLENLTTRLILIRDLLSDEGTLYVHIDWRVVHYLRLILDYVFGKERFLNEVIWSYKSGGASKRSFSKKHDNILVYTKTKNYIFNVSKEKSYNRDYKPYRFKNIEEYEDDKGWFTLVNSKDVWNIDMVGRTSKERVDYATQKPLKLLEKIILTSSNENSVFGDFFLGSGTSIIAANKHKRSWVGADNSIHSIIQVKKRLYQLEGLYKDYTSYPKEYKDLKGVKAKVFKDKIEVDLTLINLDIGDKLGNENFSIEDSYLLLDYISIKNGLDDENTLCEFFRPQIKNKLSIEGSQINLKDFNIYIVDIWGNEYLNKIKGSLF